MTHKKTMINTLLVAALFGGVNAAQAADVPAGTKLADVQQLVKGNGSEQGAADKGQQPVPLSLTQGNLALAQRDKLFDQQLEQNGNPTGQGAGKQG